MAADVAHEDGGGDVADEDRDGGHGAGDSCAGAGGIDARPVGSAPTDTAGAPDSSVAAADGPFAECVLCRAPTEYPDTYRGITLCPVCTWQEAQRTACSG